MSEGRISGNLTSLADAASQFHVAVTADQAQSGSPTLPARKGTRIGKACLTLSCEKATDAVVDCLVTIAMQPETSVCIPKDAKHGSGLQGKGGKLNFGIMFKSDCPGMWLGLKKGLRT